MEKIIPYFSFLILLYDYFHVLFIMKVIDTKNQQRTN
jgi:hypothetical protein